MFNSDVILNLDFGKKNVLTPLKTEYKTAISQSVRMTKIACMLT